MSAFERDHLERAHDDAHERDLLALDRRDRCAEHASIPPEYAVPCPSPAEAFDLDRPIPDLAVYALTGRSPADVNGAALLAQPAPRPTEETTP